MVTDVKVQLAVLAQPVQALVAGRPGGVDVHHDLQPVEVVGRLLAEQVRVENVDGSALPVRRRGEAVPLAAVVIGQRVQQRRPRLLHPRRVPALAALNRPPAPHPAQPPAPQSLRTFRSRRGRRRPRPGRVDRQTASSPGLRRDRRGRSRPRPARVGSCASRTRRRRPQPCARRPFGTASDGNPIPMSTDDFDATAANDIGGANDMLSPMESTDSDDVRNDDGDDVVDPPDDWSGADKFGMSAQEQAEGETWTSAWPRRCPTSRRTTSTPGTPTTPTPTSTSRCWVPTWRLRTPVSTKSRSTALPRTAIRCSRSSSRAGATR